MRLIDSNEVMRISTTRARYERALASDLMAAFDTCKAKPQLQQFVAQAIEQILVLTQRQSGLLRPDPAFDAQKARFAHAQGSSVQKARDAIELRQIEARQQADLEERRHRLNDERRVIEQLVKHEDKLQMWKKYHVAPSLAGLEVIARRRQDLTALDCSDLIRLYATITESKADSPADNKLLRRTGFVGGDVANQQDAARVGGDDVWKPPFRSRAVPDGPDAPHVPPHVAAARQEVLKAVKDDEPHPGIGRGNLGDNSTIRRIDAAFGLPAGADISGTTADSIFFMKHVEDFYSHVPPELGVQLGDLMPVMQLLPLATMVSHGHHTLLESAIVLTMTTDSRRYGTGSAYSIGFYETLLPGGPGSSDDPLVIGVRKILQRWDAASRDMHILCYQGTHGWEGCRFEDGMELAEFKNMACANENLLGYFRRLGRDFTQDDLLQLLRWRGYGLLADRFTQHRRSVPLQAHATDLRAHQTPYGAHRFR